MFEKSKVETDTPNAQSLESSIKAIIDAFDPDPNREGIQDTPKRVIKAYRELLTPVMPKITVFDANGYDQMISDSDIPFYSLCEHHMLPFFGSVTVAYIPNEKIIGLSKLARVVEYFSRRLNTQEYLTDNIANFLDEVLKPKGVGVKVTGRHLCKEMRGVKTTGLMTTTALRGVFSEHKVK